MRAGLLVVILLMAAAANALPIPYLTEKVSATYLQNGSLNSPVSKTGYIEVDVSNNRDVLQFIRLNLSKWNGTNLNSLTAYRDVAASPIDGQRTRIYVNTLEDAQDVSYKIYDTENNTPTISFRMDYRNLAGGKDLYSGSKNTLNFTIYFSSNMGLQNSTVSIQFSKNTFGGRDIVNVSSMNTSGNPYANDSNNNGDNDRIVWNGDLSAGSEQEISFLVETTPNTNYNENLLYADMDAGYGTNAYTPLPATFTGITFSGLFSRGPFQEGIDLLLTDKWKVRGFLKNTAYNLTYLLDGWELYRVGENNSLLSSNEPSALEPEEIKFTDWYVLAGQGKPNYFTSAFNWQAKWGSPSYYAFTESRMNLPTVQEIDLWTDKKTSYKYDTLANQTYLFVAIEDTVMHIGSSGLGIRELILNSVYPHRSNAGTLILWNITDIQVFLGNLTNQTEITGNASVQIIPADENNSGIVRVNISNFTSLRGDSLQQNEHVTLKYRAFHPAPNMFEYFKFSGNASIKTDSGTALTENIPKIDVGESPPAPPAPGAAWAPGVTKAGVPTHAEIIEERAVLSVEVTQTENLVTVTAGVRVEDNGEYGVGNASLIVRIPEEGELDLSSVKLKLYNSTSMQWAALEGDYMIRQTGAEEIGGIRYRSYSFTRAGEGWRLYDKDRLEATYTARLPFGTQYILTEFSGFNYYINRRISEGIRTPLRIAKPAEIAPAGISITEGEFEQEKATVGMPVFWIKKVRARNNGTVPVEAELKTKIFPDSLNAKIFGEGDYAAEEVSQKGEKYLVWKDGLPPQQEREYLIKAVTPPVIKKEEKTEIVESGRDIVKFITNATLENLAREDYAGIYFEYPLEKEKLLGVTGGERYSDYGNGSITIYLPRLDALAQRTIGILYREKPPVLIITPKKKVFADNCEVNISALVVSAERVKGPYLEMEVEDEQGEVHADIMPLKELDVGEKVETWRSFCIDAASAGNYTVLVRFRKDLTTIVAKKESFQVASIIGRDQKNLVMSFGTLLFILLLAAKLSSPLKRYLKERRVKKEVGDLRTDLRRKIRDYKTARILQVPEKANDIRDITVSRDLYEKSRQRLDEARENAEREQKREELQKMLSEEVDKEKKKELMESVERLKKLVREGGGE